MWRRNMWIGLDDRLGLSHEVYEVGMMLEGISHECIGN